MTVKEVSDRLHVDPWTVRDYCDQGKLIVTRNARGHRVIDPDSVERLRKERRAWTQPRRCLLCGTEIEQYQVYCKREGCKRRRERQRYHKSHQAAKAALTEADWTKDGDK